MLGAEGLKSSTEHAILNANYMKLVSKVITQFFTLESAEELLTK
jgi:glycine cleavage system protein P-like pyridoxal-binding family